MNILKPHLVYLVQTDTTVGFLSQDKKALAKAKKRDVSQPFLSCVASLKELKSFSRVPNRYKKIVRRAKRTTFIYPNKNGVRVVKESVHLDFLNKFKWMYSSSANLTGKGFDENYAKQKADIIIKDDRGFHETTPSSIIRLGKSTRRKIR